LEGAPVSQGQGQRHPILGQPVGAFPYSQQDPFPEDKEKDDEEMRRRKRRRNMSSVISKFSILEKELFWMTFTIQILNVQRKIFIWRNLSFYNVINPADRSQARWLSPCAEFYYCHACTLRMVEGIGTRDMHDNICANGNFLNWLLISFFKESS